MAESEDDVKKKVREVVAPYFDGILSGMSEDHFGYTLTKYDIEDGVFNPTCGWSDCTTYNLATGDRR